MNFVESTEFQSTYFLASREHPTSLFSCFCQKIEIFGAELIFSKEIIFFLGPQLKECNSELTPPCKRGVKFPGMKWCCSNHHYHTNEQKNYISFFHTELLYQLRICNFSKVLSDKSTHWEMDLCLSINYSTEYEWKIN